MSAEARHRSRTLWLTGILHAFTHCYAVALLPLYFRIQQDLKLRSIDQATLLVTVLGLAYFIPSYPLGVLADRMSRKRLMAVGLAINGVGFLSLSVSPSYGWAVASMVVAGFGGSFYHPSATALIAGLFPNARGRALGLVGIGASIGFFVGPIYCGWRAVDTGDWRVPVRELGVLGLLVSALFAWLAEERRAVQTSNSPTSGRLFPAGALWGCFLAASFAFSLRDFAGSAVATSASLFLQNVHGFSPKATGLALSAIFPASVISNPLFGGLSDRGRMRWLCVLVLLAAALINLFPRVPTAWIVPVLLAYGFFLMASYPITEAAIVESVPDNVRGRVFGLFITVGGLVGNLAHWVVGNWVGRLGPRSAVVQSYFPLYATLSGLMVAAVVGLPFLHALRRREHLEPQKTAAANLSALHSPDAQ
jgi:MFS family permease